MTYRGFLSAVAVALTFIAFVPYIRAILGGTVRPHVFSWVTWGAVTFVAFLAQLADGGGVGAWPIGVSGAISLAIALLAWLKRGDVVITRADRLFLGAAMSALPFWYVTSDPLWAVVILTTVDVLGFGPTVRKAYRHPHSESVPFFTLFAVRNLLGVLALEHHSATTVLFPAVVGGACALLVAMMVFRRRVAPV